MYKNPTSGANNTDSIRDKTKNRDQQKQNTEN
jgi:hypothetical protein